MQLETAHVSSILGTIVGRVDQVNEKARIVDFDQI